MASKQSVFYPGSLIPACFHGCVKPGLDKTKHPLSLFSTATPPSLFTLEKLTGFQVRGRTRSMTTSIGQGNLRTGQTQQEAGCNGPRKVNTRALSSETGSNRSTSVQHMAQPLHSPTYHRSTSARGESRAQRQQMTISLKPCFSLLALDYRDQRKP